MSKNQEKAHGLNNKLKICQKLKAKKENKRKNKMRKKNKT